jgi:hypothetical protein
MHARQLSRTRARISVPDPPRQPLPSNARLRPPFGFCRCSWPGNFGRRANSGAAVTPSTMTTIRVLRAIRSPQDGGLGGPAMVAGPSRPTNWIFRESKGTGATAPTNVPRAGLGNLQVPKARIQ